MTNDMMTLRALIEKAPDADLLRGMIGFAAHRLMELEVQGLTGAGWGEKTAARLVQRNGYRDRGWETRAGTVEGVVGSVVGIWGWRNLRLVQPARAGVVAPAEITP